MTENALGKGKRARKKVRAPIDDRCCNELIDWSVQVDYTMKPNITGEHDTELLREIMGSDDDSDGFGIARSLVVSLVTC